ncbi:nitroreductase family protein [Candidatus Woesearchaeota archaeon]|nr:MAG: nitroreductase family protein [Candidatus Woesearchaeota archaeon]
MFGVALLLSFACFFLAAANLFFPKTLYTLFIFLQVMDVFDIIYNRRSVRKFKDIPVEMEKIGKILDAGRLAPSAGNLQDWKFILVKKPETIEAVAKSCLEQFWIDSAPVLIVVCTDPSRTIEHYGNRGEFYSYHNGAAAVMSMIFAASAQGLATCWVGAFEDAMIKRILNIPDNVIVHAVLPIGYAAEKPPAPSKFNLENVTFLESYGNRIKDVAAYFQHYAEHVRAVARKGKEFVQKIAEKLSK